MIQVSATVVTAVSCRQRCSRGVGFSIPSPPTGWCVRICCKLTYKQNPHTPCRVNHVAVSHVLCPPQHEVLPLHPVSMETHQITREKESKSPDIYRDKRSETIKHAGCIELTENCFYFSPVLFSNLFYFDWSHSGGSILPQTNTQKDE